MRQTALAAGLGFQLHPASAFPALRRLENQPHPRCARMASACSLSMTVRTRVLIPSSGRCRAMEFEALPNRSNLSEIHPLNHSTCSPSRPDAATAGDHTMSIPSTLPGPSWAWRLKRLTKKKCKVCGGECTDCPHAAKSSASAASPPGDAGRTARLDQPLRRNIAPAAARGRPPAASRSTSQRGRGKPPAA